MNDKKMNLSESREPHTLNQVAKESQGLRIVICGVSEPRRLFRYLRTNAIGTGTFGWVRRTSEGEVELVVYRACGLHDFLEQLVVWLQNAADVSVSFEESLEAKNSPSFRVRREKFILGDQDDIEYYDRLGVDTAARHFPILHTSGALSSGNERDVQIAQDYWSKNWGAPVDTAFHIAYSNITGNFDPRVVPQSEYRRIWRFLNPGQEMVDAYSHKLIFSRLVPTNRQPATVMSCIDGRLYGSKSEYISLDDDAHKIFKDSQEYIIKPTNTDNGRGIALLKRLPNGTLMLGSDPVGLEDVISRYRRNFMVQEVVAQHKVLAAPHPSSVNTLRVVTLRWEGQVRHLLTFARFGVDGRVNDNAGTGGLCVGVDDDGKFRDYAVNEYAEKLEFHPNTKVKFSGLGFVPHYKNIIKYTKKMHKKIPYFDILSWDVAVGVSGNPVLIECNFKGAVWLYQFACGKPLFGDLTEEVIRHISSHS